ncbi:MAG: hypothetical protein HQL63_12405 [Magnetococcales bacterium]|nr:hypothetical protein [Magnetococcales bacterium]
MIHAQQERQTFPFCRQRWKLPLVVLMVACMGTFAWALHLVWEHHGDLGGVNYIYMLQGRDGRLGPVSSSPQALRPAPDRPLVGGAVPPAGGRP